MSIHNDDLNDEILEALEKMLEAVNLFQEYGLIKPHVPLGLALVDAKLSARNAIRKAKGDLHEQI